MFKFLWDNKLTILYYILALAIIFFVSGPVEMAIVLTGFISMEIIRFCFFRKEKKK